MICCAKPVLTDDLLRVVQKGRLFNNVLYVRNVYLTERPSVFITDKPILSSERKLHNDYCRRVKLKKNIWLWVSRGLTKDELIGGKSPVVK
jgi:hypothetical protein